MLHSLYPDSWYTAFLCHLKLSQFSPQPSPPSALLSHPSPAPPFSAPPITGSLFTGATHHHWLHVIDATFNSQVRFLIFLTVFCCSPFLFFFFLWRHCQSCLVGFLEIELWWSLLLVGRRWIWWLRLDSFWVDGFWVSIVWRISGMVWVCRRLDSGKVLVAWWTVWVGCFSWVLIFHLVADFSCFSRVIVIFQDDYGRSWLFFPWVDDPLVAPNRLNFALIWLDMY